MIVPTTELRINQMYFKVLPCASSGGDIWKMIQEKSWDSETFEFFNNFIRPDKNLTDIGGWIGTTTLQAYAYNPRKIYTIEADPANFQTLKHNIAMNLAGDKITAFQACLTDKANSNKNMMFGKANNDRPNSSSHRLDSGSRVSVKTINALPFLKRNCELSKGGVYNIDIEGSEKYLSETFDYLSRRDAMILLSLHAPYWGEDKEKVTNNLMKEFVKYRIICPFSYGEIKYTELKDKLLDNSPNKKEKGLQGQFFPIIMQSKGR